MSIAYCACGTLIDSDEDPECFGEDGEQPARCEPCREEAADLANDLALEAEAEVA